MLMEPDWLNMLVDRDEKKKLHYSSWPTMILVPRIWTLDFAVLLTGM